MKKYKFIILFLISCAFFSACKNQEHITEVNKIEEFKNNAEKIIELIYNNTQEKSEYQNNSINNYRIYNNRVIGFNYNNNIKALDHNLDYNIEGYNFSDGIIYEKNNGEIYLSIKNDEFCALKDFNDAEIKVYDISEEGQCHKTNFLDKFSTTIVALKLGTNEDYEPNTISEDYIQFIVLSNILDTYGCIYKWYRNNEVIENMNVESYVIPLDKEDADYHVEIITPDGTIIKSNVVNVKIDIK